MKISRSCVLLYVFLLPRRTVELHPLFPRLKAAYVCNSSVLSQGCLSTSLAFSPVLMRLANSSHRSPTSLPQVKHLTGIITFFFHLTCNFSVPLLVRRLHRHFLVSLARESPTIIVRSYSLKTVRR